MKKQLFLWLLAMVSLVTNVSAQGWQQVWSDEFNGGISSDWVFETGRGSSGWGNNELQYYRRENATVENGALVITARRENFGGAAYTSARMKTQGRKSWKYGRMEARIAMPAFQGVWPAFWMLGDNISSVGWPSCGEIDVMEHINGEHRTYGTIHWSDQYGNYANYGGNTGVNNITGYHTYAVEWDANRIKWFLDGVQYHEVNIAGGVNGTSEFHNNFFLLLNMAIGGNWPGFAVDNNAFPAKMYVDYVRVFKWTNNPPPPPPGGNVTLFEHCSYGGFGAGFGVGDYNLGQLQARGIGNDYVSSIRVAAGYEAILYWDDNFQGASFTVGGDNSCLVDEGWNDKVSSMRVRIKGTSYSKFIEAEQYTAMNGVQTEGCVEGGLNVGWIDPGDWMAYSGINIPSSGTYKIEYRVASPGGSQLSADLNAGSIQLGTVGIPATGGWQNWTTVSHNVHINAGNYSFGVFAPQGSWNINWIKITSVSGARTAKAEEKAAREQETAAVAVSFYPNPVEDQLHVADAGVFAGGQMTIVNAQGNPVYQGAYNSTVDVSGYAAGIYTVKLVSADGEVTTGRFIKQ